MNCKNTLDSKTHSFNPGQMLFTILALLVIVSFTSLSYAEYPSPLKQMESGVAPEDIMCNTGYVHVIRDNGNHACLTEKTAEKVVERFGWKIIEQKSEPSQITDNTSVEQVLPPTATYVENITFTTPEIKEGTTFSLGPKIWPIYNVTFPGTAQVGVPFDVTYEYTYVIPDEDTGRYTHPEMQCTSWRCENDVFSMGGSSYVDVIKEGAVSSGKSSDFKHLPMRNYTGYTYTPEYDNTKPLSEKFTFVVNEPDIDYRIGQLGISFSERSDGVKFYVDETGKIFFFDYLKHVEFSPEQFRSKFSAQTKDVDSFVTKVEVEANKLELRPMPELRHVQGKNTEPTNREVWPGFKDFLLDQYPEEKNFPELFRSWNYTEPWIRSFISNFPELEPQGFDFVAKFILPSAYATQTTITVSGQLSNTNFDNSTSFVHGATVCAYDVTPAGDLEPISLNGVNVCSETTQSGTFLFDVPVADPNGTGNTDLRLIAKAENQYIEIYENINNLSTASIQDDVTNTVPSNTNTLNVGTFDISTIQY